MRYRGKTPAQRRSFWLRAALAAFGAVLLAALIWQGVQLRQMERQLADMQASAAGDPLPVEGTPSANGGDTASNTGNTPAGPENPSSGTGGTSADAGNSLADPGDTSDGGSTSAGTGSLGGIQGRRSGGGLVFTRLALPNNGVGRIQLAEDCGFEVLGASSGDVHRPRFRIYYNGEQVVEITALLESEEDGVCRYAAKQWDNAVICEPDAQVDLAFVCKDEVGMTYEFAIESGVVTGDLFEIQPA